MLPLSPSARYNARMIETYEQAREAVRAEIEPLWGETRGTFYVAPEGYEDRQGFYVPWGAREWMVDNDPEFVLLNNAATFVDKATGFVSLTTYSTEIGRIAEMEPVGARA